LLLIGAYVNESVLRLREPQTDTHTRGCLRNTPWSCQLAYYHNDI